MHNARKSLGFLAAVLLGAAGAGATTTPVTVELGQGAQTVGEVGVGNKAPTP